MLLLRAVVHCSDSRASSVLELGKECFGDRTMTGHADVRITRQRFAQELSSLLAIVGCATVNQHGATKTADLRLLQPMGKVFGLLQSETEVLFGGVPVLRRCRGDAGYGLWETRDPGEADRSSGEELAHERIERGRLLLFAEDNETFDH
jgi:hypothetical protein